MAISGRMPSYRSWKRCWTASRWTLCCPTWPPIRAVWMRSTSRGRCTWRSWRWISPTATCKPGGTFLIKLFQGVGFDDYVRGAAPALCQGGDPQAGGVAQAVAGGLCPGAGQAGADEVSAWQCSERDAGGVEDERLGQESDAVGGRRRRADGGVPELQPEDWAASQEVVYSQFIADVQDDRIKKVDIAERRAHDQVRAQGRHATAPPPRRAATRTWSTT